MAVQTTKEINVDKNGKLGMRGKEKNNKIFYKKIVFLQKTHSLLTKNLGGNFDGTFSSREITYFQEVCQSNLVSAILWYYLNHLTHQNVQNLIE